MYTLFNGKTIWSISPTPVSQVFYTAVPATPIVLNVPPTPGTLTSQPTIFRYEPTCYMPKKALTGPREQRLSSDDVFIPEGAYYVEPSLNDYVTTSIQQRIGYHDDVFIQSMPVTSQANTRSKELLLCPSNNVSADTSKNNSGCTSSPERQKAVKQLGYSLETSSNVSSNSNTSSPNSKIQDRDDSIVKHVFSASLCAALNDDPPEPAAAAAPLKTSSPIRETSMTQTLLCDMYKIRKRRGNIISSITSEKCPRFSENGREEDLDQCDKIILQSRTNNPVEDQARKREEFLLILEAERERQKKLVLPRHAPKMACKFCKNNGEPEEVYTKHRLHYNEKTVCPILRHYVCRLCNSTGDFAHTIRHCPFNDRKDKIAWKATFLV